MSGPLWVISRHLRRKKVMSALAPKADMCGAKFLAVVFCYADVLMRDPMPAKQKCGENKAVVAIPSYSLSCFDPLT